MRRYEQHQQKLIPFLTGRGLGAVTAERFRLGYVEPGEDTPRQFWHRMAIPYLTPTGVVQIRYRCLIDHHKKGQDPGPCPKFMGEPGVEVTLYNPAATLQASGGPLFLTEGEPDTWAIETLTGYPAVGIPGAQAWTKHRYWARCFVGHSHLILPADGDAAGEELAKTVRADLPEVHLVRLPDSDDANSVLQRDPVEFLRRCGLAEQQHA